MARKDLHEASIAFKALLWEAKYGLASRSHSLVEWALAPYRVFPHMLRKLKPDVILTQICAHQVLEKEEVVAAIQGLVDQNLYLIDINPNNLEDVWKDIFLVAKVLGKNSEAQQVTDNLKARLALVKKISTGRPKKQVLCLEWGDPLCVAKSIVSEIMSLVGGINVDARSRSKMLNWDLVKVLDPEVLVVGIPHYGLEESFQRIIDSAKNFLPKSSTLLNPQLFVVSGITLFSKSGPGIIELLEVLAEILHPESQPFGHLDVLWRRLELV
ncbi:hypothetical protein O6H91_Y381000 [Diphasiastrum complanatum]|nr:hypothetical protein O6H91_Y381000 [Diphasiastrum complanatum]